MLKKFLIYFSIFFIFFGTKPIYALEERQNVQEVYFENGYYYETIIETFETPYRNTTTQGARKTTNCKNASGDIIWYVTVYGVYTYDGKTATCTSSSVIAESNVSSWEIDSKKTSRSGASATATAIAKQYLLGVCIDTVTKSVTLTCTPTGNFY